MSGLRSCSVWMSLALGLCLMLAAGAAGEDSCPFPVLRVPALSAPPRIDGRIEAEEWAGAAAITGVGTLQAAGFTASVVPEMQQVVWYLAYDAGHVYLAMHSPHPVGTLPRSRVKVNDESYRILFEDHVEIQLCKYERTQAATPGLGFYKIMANPRGYFSDEWYYNGTPGTERDWSMGGTVRCTVEKDHWDLELSAPLQNFGVESLDGKTWVIQLVRTDSCAGIYFAGWAPVSWMEWHRFAAVTFDPQTPTFQFLKTGEIRKGQIDTFVALTGTTVKEQEAGVSVSLWAGDKKLFEKTRHIVLKQGQRQELAWAAKDLPIQDKGNVFRIRAALAPAKPGQPETVIYRAEIPVLKLTDAYVKQYIEPWVKGRPSAGEWNFRFAYSPYRSCIDASVDLDFLGMPETILKAGRFRLSLAPEGGRPLFTAQAFLKDMQGHISAAVPGLAEGKYVAEAILYAADGKTELSRKQCHFVRKKFPWEHNRIGISDRVIPPYTPLEVKGSHLQPWGRDYVIGKNGLPESVRVSWQSNGGSPNQQLLALPIRLEAKVNGKVTGMTDSKLAVKSARPHRAELRARGTLAGVPVETESFMDYDGWYQVKLTLSPRRPVRFEQLDLVCDLWPGADTIYAQRTDVRSGSKFGAVPEGRGVVWHSGQLPSLNNGWGSFVPVVFLGSGDMGLWWLAETDSGWERARKSPCVQILRGPKSVTMRLRFFGQPVELNSPRTIEFALLVTPVKPKPVNWRAFAWGWPEPHFAHDTTGYRYWGDSVDAYALSSDGEYQKLRQFILNPRKVNPAYSWFQRLSDQVLAGKPLVLYGSTQMTGMGMEEFDTFAGEWLGTNNFSTRPDNSFKGKTNYQNTVTWKTPRQLAATGVNFSQSQVDCFIWYHRKLVELARVNGTWWDNRSLSLIYEYVPGKGKVWKWNVFTRRQLTKRLATMCWELGVPPLWIENMHVDFSWCQAAWHIENDFYPAGIGQDLLGMLSLDEFRGMTAIKGGIIPQLHSRVPSGTENLFDIERIVRTGLGLCLLHDIGERGYPTYQPFINRQRKRMLEAMEKYVRFFSAHPNNLSFIPYWRQRVVKTSTPGIVASVYYNRNMAKAILVLLNTNDRDLVLKDFTLDGRSVGLPRISRLIDAETELPVGKAYDRKKRRYVWGELHPYELMIRRHDIRLLVIE